MAGFIPIFVLMLFYYKKYANKNSSIITPLKVVAAVLLVLLAIKQIFNAVLGNFTKGYLPLHLSDFCIFSLALFSFTKLGTQIHKFSTIFGKIWE
jgi:hypothetical protein